MVISKIKNALESFYLIPAIFVFVVLGRALDVINVTLPIIALVIVLVLVLCDDVKNVLAIIFYAPFYIKDLNMFNMPNLYAVLIVGVVSALLYFTIKKIKQLKNQNAIIKGKLYLPLVLITLAYLLGGVFYGFRLTSALTITVFSLASVFFYFIALNCVKNPLNFMCKVFVVGGILVSFMLLYENFVKHGGIEFIFNRSYDTWVGAENVNVASLFVFLGIGGAFGLGYKTTKDRFYFILSVVFYFFIVITYCRMMLVVGSLALLTFTVLSLIKSPNVKKYLVYIGGILLVLTIGVIICWDTILVLIREMSYKSLLGGREELWPWCIEMFKKHPLFGIGFKIPEVVPTMGAGADNYVLAHNTILQWLTSLGIVGTLLMTLFSVVKYQIVLKGFKGKGVIISILIIFVALNGMMDQAPQMDPFIYNIVIVLIASIEKLCFHKIKQEIENEKN